MSHRWRANRRADDLLAVQSRGICYGCADGNLPPTRRTHSQPPRLTGGCLEDSARKLSAITGVHGKAIGQLTHYTVWQPAPSVLRRSRTTPVIDRATVGLICWLGRKKAAAKRVLSRVAQPRVSRAAERPLDLATGFEPPNVRRSKMLRQLHW